MLALAHFVDGCLTLLFSMIPLFYVGMGVLFSTLATSAAPDGKGPPPAMGYAFAAIGVLLFLLGVGRAALAFLTAKALRARRNRTLCLVVACLSLPMFPYGMILGGTTLMVLARPSVNALFMRPPHL